MATPFRRFPLPEEGDIGGMSMKKGDIVYLDYDAFFVDGDELFETTNEALAKEKGMHEEGRTYGSVTTIIGEDRLIPGLDKSLLAADVGKEVSIEIPPAEAYGERDPKMVEVHSKNEILRLPEFQKGDKEPYVGMQIQLKNKVGTITTVSAGRVRVDFNNRMAGKALRYKYTIKSIVETPAEKVKAIIGMDYVRPDEFKVAISGDVAEIVLSDMCKYDSGWIASKFRLVADIRKYAGIDKIRFVEEYVKRAEEEKKEEAKEEGEEKKG
jgi:FKBP-type peptidyl-prolyl cis-trans isomerase 2